MERNFGRLAPKASNPAACLCWLGSQYPKFAARVSRDWLRFCRDQFESAISAMGAPSPTPRVVGLSRASAARRCPPDTKSKRLTRSVKRIAARSQNLSFCMENGGVGCLGRAARYTKNAAEYAELAGNAASPVLRDYYQRIAKEYSVWAEAELRASDRESAAEQRRSKRGARR